MMLRPVLKRSVLGLVLVSAVGCLGGPRQRPVEGGPVDKGPESITAARKFLEGRWTLESFEVFPPGKAAITLKGAGTLNYDEFGNLRIEIRAEEKAADLLRAAGVEVRDGTDLVRRPRGRRHAEPDALLILPGQTVGAPAAGPLAPSRPRHWEVKGDLLFLSTWDENGKPLSTGRWRKMP